MGKPGTDPCRRAFCRRCREELAPRRVSTLSLLFHALHLAVIAGNLTGWMFRSLRRLHLALVSVTLFSWIVLGFRYGLGYCFLTEWHWQVLESEGESGLPASYITYIIFLLTGWNADPWLVDAGTGISFSFAVCASLYVNRDLFLRSAKGTEPR